MSAWLIEPPNQWVGAECGATSEVGVPLKSTRNVGPGLRHVSYDTPYGSAVGVGDVEVAVR